MRLPSRQEDIQTNGTLPTREMGPSITCLCPTYGRCPERQWLLEETVYSFLQQDYSGEKELIVLNDCPEQTLVFRHPQVRIINWKVRLATLGAKYNLMIGLAKGNVLVPWEDDDLSLPHRLSQTVKYLQSFPYWNPRQLYYWEKGKPPRRDHGGACHNASAYTKQAWLAVGGYPNASGAQDGVFDGLLRKWGPVAPPLSPQDKPGYIYRWGVSDFHLSSNRDHERVYREYGATPKSAGTFTLIPQYKPETQEAIDLLLAT